MSIIDSQILTTGPNGLESHVSVVQDQLVENGPVTLTPSPDAILPMTLLG